MIVSRQGFLLLINLILAIILYFFDGIGAKFCAAFAFFVTILLIWNFTKFDEKRITLSSALLLYTITTQFGLIIPYLLVGRETMASYSDYTLRFMQSPYLCKAILLGIIGVTSMQIGTMISRRACTIGSIDLRQGEDKNDDSVKMYIVGSILLCIVLLFFAGSIALGRMQIAATYEQFRNSATYNSSIYSYVLIIFYVGTVYLASSGNVKNHRLGWMIWLIIVIIFALNGNKGEFMYALLAVVGIKGIQGQKINIRMILAISVLLFIVIPMITTLRSIGIIGNVRNAQFELFDSFGEMGMQIRMSVYTLMDLAEGKFEYIWGKSYIQPLINIITPFMKHSQATANIRAEYPGHGFSQIIESYINFSLPGVILYNLIVGWFVGKRESLIENHLQLAYIGTITCILINATRNYFAFVPGQLIMISVIYFVVKKLKIGRSVI